MIGLDKRRLDAWAEETKRNTTGLFRDSQQAHAIGTLINSVAQIIDENNREIAESLSKASIDPQGSSRLLVMGDEPQSQGNQDGVTG
jgi:hypothetical protein